MTRTRRSSCLAMMLLLAGVAAAQPPSGDDPAKLQAELDKDILGLDAKLAEIGNCEIRRYDEVIQKLKSQAREAGQRWDKFFGEWEWNAKNIKDISEADSTQSLRNIVKELTTLTDQLRTEKDKAARLEQDATAARGHAKATSNEIEAIANAIVGLNRAAADGTTVSGQASSQLATIKLLRGQASKAFSAYEVLLDSKKKNKLSKCQVRP